MTPGFDPDQIVGYALGRDKIWVAVNDTVYGLTIDDKAVISADSADETFKFDRKFVFLFLVDINFLDYHDGKIEVVGIKDRKVVHEDENKDRH